MPKVTFREERCKGCGLCTLACPKKILEISSRVNRSGYAVAAIKDEKVCTGCTFCAEMCPDLAIMVYK